DSAKPNIFRRFGEAKYFQKIRRSQIFSEDSAKPNIFRRFGEAKEMDFQEKLSIRTFFFKIF
ncbi:MAG: hypothetical protein IJ163_06555, partial [Bacteroidaceae bacterium]|nr:hypothetical protein [Bacteroidaceae bacterium]